VVFAGGTMLSWTRSSSTLIRGTFAASALWLAGTGLAQAQWFPSAYRPPVVMDELTPREAVSIVIRQGYRSPSRPVYQDDVVLVSAIDPSGRRMRLVLDVYSGRIVDRLAVTPPRPIPQPREQVVQRVPDQGPVIRRSVPEQTEKTRATPERPTTIRREPMLPPQVSAPSTPRAKITAPEKPAAAAQPPQAAVGSGTKETPRRIDMLPPAELDAPPAAPKAPSGPPINSVPPAGLE
jgi:hypothetical protein